VVIRGTLCAFLSGSWGTQPRKYWSPTVMKIFADRFEHYLSSLSYEVIEAVSGAETIEMASTLRPDLIIMDVQLPGLKSDEVTRQLKRKLSTQQIPVVINTGWTTDCNVEERIDRALTAGAAEVLYRPLQLPMLRNVMRSYLSA
jgi:CheY-like chemotaxis protein